MNKQYLEELIDKGLSLRSISQESGKSTTSIRHWLNKYKLKTKWESFKKKERVGTKQVCKKHGLTEYTTGKNSRCRKCSTEAVQKRRDKLKELAVEYKGGKCEKCGYNKYIGALEFHHLNPNEKDFGIASKGYTNSWERVKKELDKCILLCANCHREEHKKDGLL